MKIPENFVLETKRLELRLLEKDHVELLWPHVTNPKIAQYMSWNPHESIEETEALVDRLISEQKELKSITWSIFHKENKDFCGIFSIIAILQGHRSCVYDRAELACWCVPKYQIDRIMQEAGARVIDFAFQDLNLNKLMNGHFVVNVASERFMVGLGFEYIGIERRAFRKNGEWHDIKTYEMMNPNYIDE